MARLDAIGLDGVLHRPLGERDLLSTVQHLLSLQQSAVASVA